MKILVLGGAGSVGRKICEIGLNKGYQIVSADIKPQNFEKVDCFQADILDFDNFKKLTDDSAPDIIVNCLNLATIYSRGPTNRLQDLINFYLGLYQILLSLNHVHYIQVGTTGTGGMGVNAQFSHGEDLSKLPLFLKASYAGACTALLTILSRSFSDTSHKVSEVKPGLAIFNDEFIESENDQCSMVLTDGGENGNYTYNELGILTAFMGFTTADKIAEKVFAVIKGERSNKLVSNFDVIESANQTIVRQDEEDEKIRDSLLRRMAEKSTGNYIVATGNLGPPSLTRDLILAALLLDHHYQSGDQFNKVLAKSESCQQTLSYITMTNKDLGSYLRHECNYQNYLVMQKLIGQHHFNHPWEIVARQIALVSSESTKENNPINSTSPN